LNIDSDKSASFYYNNALYIHETMAEDLSIALHEYSHRALLKAARTALQEDDEIEAALAAYLAASFLKSPIIGANLGKLFGVSTPNLMTLSNDLTYSVASRDWHGREQVWAAALWACRDNGEQIDKLIRGAWDRANSNGTSRKERIKGFSEALAKAPPPAGQCLVDQFARRGLPH
jgi:hypothetical protein